MELFEDGDHLKGDVDDALEREAFEDAEVAGKVFSEQLDDHDRVFAINAGPVQPGDMAHIAVVQVFQDLCLKRNGR